jgi:predicted AAA+ superfamily ATPase
MELTIPNIYVIWNYVPNLLAGRALNYLMHPLTAIELGKDFNLNHSLSYGHLPSVYVESNPNDYLESYIKTYLQEEILQEGLTRNLGVFARFLEAASFSQASVLNISEVSRECETSNNLEVDFVLYGERGLKAFEIKRRGKISSSELRSLKAFLKDYPTSKAYFIYGGERRMSEGRIDIIPMEYALKNLPEIL